MSIQEQLLPPRLSVLPAVIVGFHDRKSYTASGISEDWDIHAAVYAALRAAGMFPDYSTYLSRSWDNFEEVTKWEATGGTWEEMRFEATPCGCHQTSVPVGPRGWWDIEFWDPTRVDQATWYSHSFDEADHRYNL